MLLQLSRNLHERMASVYCFDMLYIIVLILSLGCVVAMTGPIDYVSDGERVYAIENGDPLLASITGSGCMVSSIVGCFTAGKFLVQIFEKTSSIDLFLVTANRHDYLLATVAA